MSEKRCKECKYFMQHYGLSDGRLFEISCGHCRFARAKQKGPESKACQNFVEGLTDGEKFVTKHYLTKELLKKILELELLDIE